MQERRLKAMIELLFRIPVFLIRVTLGICVGLLHNDF